MILHGWRPRIGENRTIAERSVPELAIAVFGYKTHVAIDRTFGFIRSWAVTSASRHDGAVLREIVTTQVSVRPKPLEDDR